MNTWKYSYNYPHYNGGSGTYTVPALIYLMCDKNVIEGNHVIQECHSHWLKSNSSGLRSLHTDTSRTSITHGDVSSNRYIYIYIHI